MSRALCAFPPPFFKGGSRKLRGFPLFSKGGSQA